MFHEKSLFCVFCDFDDLRDKESAIHHYWNHIRHKLIPTNPESESSIPAIQVLDFAREWTSSFVDSLDLLGKNSCRKWKDQFRNCPVCHRTAGSEMIQGIKARRITSERDHMRAHLQYKKFLCKICSRDNNVTYPKNQIVAFHDGKKDITVHRIKSMDRVKHFTSCKGTRRSVLKHIRDAHLGPEVSSDTNGQVVDVDQLVVEFEIYAVEQLINNCSTVPHIPLKDGNNNNCRKNKPVKELVIINSDESRNNFKMKIEPMNPEVLAQGRNSLLKPNFNFSPTLKKKRRKKVIDSSPRHNISDTANKKLFQSGDPRTDSLQDHNYSYSFDKELDDVLEDLLDNVPELSTCLDRSNHTIHPSYSVLLNMMHFTEDLEHFDVDENVLKQFSSELVMSSELEELCDFEQVNCGLEEELGEEPSI